MAYGASACVANVLLMCCYGIRCRSVHMLSNALFFFSYAHESCVCVYIPPPPAHSYLLGLVSCSNKQTKEDSTLVLRTSARLGVREKEMNYRN
jgi:hypothetical protein